MENLDNRFSKSALEDFGLISKAVSGDQQAFAKLLKRYKRAVFHLILKMVRNVDDAEDLMMESFAKAFKNLHKFKNDYSFSTWLFRIATNNTIDFLRKKRVSTFSINNEYENDDGSKLTFLIQDSNPNPQEVAIKEQKKELIQDFIKMLPKKYQKLVRLRYFQELSYEEIAKTLKSPLGTIKAQLHRARELMYDLIKNGREHF